MSALNRCRMYLHVTYVSEICTGDGLALSENAWHGHHFEVPHRIASWPKYHRPPNKEWLLWRTFLKKTMLHRGLRLRCPLGKWLRFTEEWEWYYSPSQECLFKQVNGTWSYFSQIHKRDHLPTFVNQGVQTSPPKDACRATIYSNKQRIICTGFAPTKATSIDKVSTFSQFIQLAEEGEKWCFAHLDMTDEGITLAQAIS
jgi:hypothetical protein